MKIVSEVMAKMIAYSNGNLHDINHLLKVHGYARTIGILEGVDVNTQKTLEVAAILHDIACPLCREKYGNTNGRYQEIEGEKLTFEFLKSFEMDEAFVNRVAYLVGHHHTLTQIEGMDYQILIEADYIVNAGESQHPKDKIRNVINQVFKTSSGKALIESIYFQKNQIFEVLPRFSRLKIR